MGFINTIFNALTGKKKFFENWTLGVDTSKWNGNINWSIMTSKNVKFGITKATDIGSATHEGFVDEKAFENYGGMKANRILTGGYCWLDPQYHDGEYQAKYYLDNFYNSRPTDLPPVLDFEDTNVISWTDMLWRAQRWLETVVKETGRRPIVYTSPGYMSRFPKNKSGWLSEYPLWVAHYIQREYPTVPYPWSDWKIWQYSDKGHYPSYIYKDPLPGRGKEYGCDSYYLDMNWFKGTYFDLLDFCDTDEPLPPIPVPPPEEEDALFMIKCKVYALSIRSGPGTSHAVLGYLRSGDIENVYEVKNGWYRIRENASEWVSGSSSYVEKIDDEENSDVLFQAKCIAHALSIRSGPSTAYSIRGYLKNGDIVNVYEERGGWFKISKDENKWCSGYSSYMQKL